MSPEERLQQLEKTVANAAAEIQSLKAELTPSALPELPLGGSGWGFGGIAGEVKDGVWSSAQWVFRTSTEAEWTRRHELAWRIVRHYADILNPPGWMPEHSAIYYSLRHLKNSTTDVVALQSPGPVGNVVPFFLRSEAEAVLKLLGTNADYLWSTDRKLNERAQREV